MGVSARSCWLSLHPGAISGWSTSSSLIWFPQATPQAPGGLSGPLCLPGGLLLDAVSPSCAAELLKEGVARSTGLAGSVSRMEGSVCLSLDPPAPFATWQHLFSGSLTCPVWEGGVGES